MDDDCIVHTNGGTFRQKPIKRRTRKKMDEDPQGYLVLSYGRWQHVSLCRTRSGADRSAKASGSYGQKTLVVGISDIIKWNDTGDDALAALFALEDER